MSAPIELPPSVPVLVIGAGVHGLSTAWHLAEDDVEVLVVDKTRVAAGASGIACGVVRNNYFQPAMAELMAACVEVWESDPEAFHYHGSGYIALGPPSQQGDLTEVFERQERIGYPSELHLGAEAVERHMRSLYSDWRAPGLTVCLHEKAGGFAFNQESMHGLADKARAAGATILAGGGLQGEILEPTVVADAHPDLKVSCEEVFGPVCTVAAYESLDDAIELANGTRYGLQAGIFTARLATALEAARRLEFGGVIINEAPTFRADQMPYGGVKASGNTREGPAYAVRELTSERLVVIDA